MISGQLVFGPPAHSAFFAPAQVQQKLLVRPFPRLQQTQTRTPRSCAQPYTAEHAQRQQQQRAEPEVTTRRRVLLAGKALLLAATCPCCAQLAQAEEHAAFSYAGDNTGPSAWPGTCSIGEKQSPINIALAEHFAQITQETNNGQKQKIGDMKIHFEQKQDGIGDLGFDFQHELNDAENFKFDIEQNVEDFGNIKFHFELKFQQKPNRFGDISFQYNNQVGAVVKNTGHGTMQVNAPKGNMSQISGRDLELVQWHFHTPSEHAFDGARKAMEAHLVHKDTKTGGLAVVAVLLDIGPAPPNPALQFALSLAPEASHEQQTADQQPMQLESLLPQQKPDGHRPYIHYVGSLTTPPCSEDVQWFVFGDTVTIPYSQVVQFQEYAGKANPGLRANARPLQPINNRTVDYADFL